ncbi:MAG: GNAT family N-acetyltransferase [Lachnospiraceae bacterium]
MLYEDIKECLKENQLYIKENRYDDILQLYTGNEEYSKISNHFPQTMEGVVQDVNQVPDFLDKSQKLYLSIYNADDKLVAVADLLDGYHIEKKKDAGSIWIGLLEIERSKHKTGLGSVICKCIVKAAGKNGKKVAQLGVIKENREAILFWEKQGFKTIRDGNDGELDLNIMEKQIVYADIQM